MIGWIRGCLLGFAFIGLQGCGGGGSGTAAFTIGGTVSGLSGGTVVLQNNGGDNLGISASGSFTFDARIANGSNYSVTVLTQPAGQFCSVSNGSGVVNAASVNSVSVSCNTSCTEGNGANINISGNITFDRVHHAVDGGLDYNNITQDPVRGAVVEAVCNSAITDSSATDGAGNYSVSVPAGTQNMFIRVKAQMQQTGTPSWNFRVIDNTAGGALYALDSSQFDSGVTSSVLNLNAASGWGGSSYTSVRAAAPFAILDSVYTAFNTIIAADANAVFPALNINWSVKNVLSDTDNTSVGEIITSHFNGSEIFILGKANNDADEYDDHVIIHEWGHYFEYNFSRADNIGGDHGEGDVLDIRVAFGEGFGNAFSGIATDDAVYADASGSLQASGFTFNVESNCSGAPASQRGWHSECSVQSILFDLYDAANDANDSLTLGFLPLYNVLVGAQKNTPAMTSIFSFIAALKDDSAADAAIDTLIAAQGIDSVTDEYGTGQSTNNTGSADALPVYKTRTVGVAVVNLCSSDEFQLYNGYEVSRFIKFNLSSQQALTITASYSSGAGNDPDLILWRDGVMVQIAESVTVNSETMNTANLGADDYVLELFDYDNQDTGVGSTCYNVSIN